MPIWFIPDSLFSSNYTTYPNKDTLKANAHILEVGLGHKLDIRKDIKLGLYFQYASKFGYKDVNSGYLIKGPEFELNFKHFKFGLSYVQENGKIIDGHMGKSYMSNRIRPISISNDSLYITTYDYLNNLNDPQYFVTSYNDTAKIIGNSRNAYGLQYSFNMSILNGLNINFKFNHDFLNRLDWQDTTFTHPVPGNQDSTIKIKPLHYSKNLNYKYDLSVCINKKLTKIIEYGEIYIRQENSSYFPSSGSFFTTWDSEAGINIQTAPLIFNMALDLGYKFSYIDISNESGTWGSLNNNIDGNDGLSEFYIGIRWGYTRQSRKLL